MAALHSALQSLGPCKFEEVPSSPLELEPYLQDLFQQSQLILESIPIPPPDEKLEPRPRSHTTSSIASNASEISSSSARSAPPVAEYAALQKEWGKPIKLAAKDNPLNMAVYKMGGKDGRGAWFARRSVHEGLGFAKFKKSLEMEFPESLAVQGAPGEGNIRGIGGDRKVEDISVPGKGRLEVFQLSAQFPGPTTPRDFVTLLVTSSNAVKQNDEFGRPDLSPRHYMIISKPCDHPETQPRASYVRGNYESIEFIREVPRLPRKTMSSLDFSKLNSGKGSLLKKEAVLRNAGEAEKTDPYSTSHGNKSMNDLNAASKETEEKGRRRGKTISFSDRPADELRANDDENDDTYRPEFNPVEWIMVTRSDPGGSVPRFMVERGTPGSIVADASKFLDWACQKQHVNEDSKNDSRIEMNNRRESYASYELNGHLAGINGDSSREGTTSDERPSSIPSVSNSSPQSASQSGILSNMTGAFSAGLEAYAPQAVLDRLPSHTSLGLEATTTKDSAERDDDNETDSDSLSTTSFASADSHFDISSDDQPSVSPSLSKTTTNQAPGSKDTAKHEKEKFVSSHEKELAKLTARRAALDAKLASTRAKSQKDHESQTTKERDAIRKAEEKHAKEMQKQEEKYRKEVEKMEHRRRREERRVEEKKKKEEEKTKEKIEGKSSQDKGKEKDEKKKLERERDEARKEISRLKSERDVWIRQIGDLQRENTGLVAKVGRLEQQLKGSSFGKGSLESVAAEDGSTQQAARPSDTILQPIIVDRDTVKSLLREARTGETGGNGNGGGSGNVSEKGSVRSLDSARSRSSTWLKRQMSGMGVGVGSGVGSGNGGLQVPVGSGGGSGGGGIVARRTESERDGGGEGREGSSS